MPSYAPTETSTATRTPGPGTQTRDEITPPGTQTRNTPTVTWPPPPRYTTPTPTPPLPFCTVDGSIISGPGIQYQIITPPEGLTVLKEDELLRLVVEASDVDRLIQLCGCTSGQTPLCSDAQMITIVDPVNWEWTLTGPGRLRTGDGPSNIYEPPDIPVGAHIDFEVIVTIRDSRGNDNLVRIHFKVRIERPTPCEYRRTIRIIIEDNPYPDRSITQSPCDCEPRPPIWEPEPVPIDAFLTGPTIVCVGERYLLDAGGADSDVLDLECEGPCGDAQDHLSLPDELTEVWSARLGSFPDHPSPVTTGWRSHVIYKAPDKPGIEQVEVLVKDSGQQGTDKTVRKKLVFPVVTVDLDVDSDNTRESDETGAQQDPERTDAEDRIEDDACLPGKILPVNDADRDADCQRDFVDGFNLNDQEGPDASRRFTPVILEIPEPVDLAKARVRFLYSASNPAASGSTGGQGGGAAPAPGDLRLWAKDGDQSRLKETLDQGGDYAAPDVWYRPLTDFRNSIGGRTWRFFLEGIVPSADPGDRRIQVELDPDGSGVICRDAVRTTVVRIQNVPAESVEPAKTALVIGGPVTGSGGTPVENDELPQFLTRSRPTIELGPFGTSSMRFITENTLRLSVSGSVFDKIADIASNRGADIAEVTALDKTMTVRRDAAEPKTRARPHAFRGRFAGEIDVALVPGKNKVVIQTSPNAIGLVGEIVVTVEAVHLRPGSPEMRVVGVKVGESAPEGCFHSYFARVRDARGVLPSIELGEHTFAMEHPGDKVSLTKQPYVLVDRPLRVTDPNIVRLKRGDPLRWKYGNVAGQWPVTDVAIDADANRDGQIDAADEPVKALSPGARVVLNGQPDNANEIIDGPADRAQMTTVILRRPATMADDAIARAVLRKSGEGKVRVFLPSGSADEVILRPADKESRDLWNELKHGDVTLLVEGVEKGPLLLTLDLDMCTAHCGDSIALEVIGYRLSIGSDEPFLDADSGDQTLTVAADHIAIDYDGIESLGVNLYALFAREDELEQEEPAPDREVTWEVEPDSSNVGCQSPTLRDLQVASNPQPRIDHAVVSNLFSRVQLDYTFAHPDGRWVKSGDAFRVRVKALAPDGERLEKEILVVISAGEKRFHVTNPPDGFNPLSMWKMTDAQFVSAFKDAHFDAPVGSAAQAPISVYLFDQFRNVVEPGTQVNWKMEGSGLLGQFDPDPNRKVDPEENPKLAQMADGQVGAGGLASIQFTQTRYPSCPWQPDVEIQPSAILIGVDNRLEQANTSVVDRSDPLPAAVGPLNLARPLSTVSAEFMHPDIALDETRPIRVRLTRTTSRGSVPLAGVKLNFSSLNGRLKPPDGIATTDATGEAQVELTAKDARPGEIVVVAAIGTLGVRASYDQMRWVNSNPVQVEADHAVIAGDRTADGIIQVETLQDKGERKDFPQAVEGDGYLGVPFWAGTNVTIRGAPGHLFVVTVTDDASWQLAARYPFDVVDAGKTPDVVSSRAAAVRGASVDPMLKAEGLASLRFGGADTVDIPGSPAVDLAGGLRVQLYVRPDLVAPAVLLERAGQYKLEIQPGGTVAFTVGGGAAAKTVRSARPLPPSTWSSIEVLATTSAVLLTVETPGQPLDTAHDAMPPVSAVASSVGVTVGSGFRGHLDDLRFTKGQPSTKPVVNVIGLVGGTIRTDANGKAQFRLQSSGDWDPNRYVPVTVTIRVDGSPSAQTKVQVAPATIWADFVAMGKAFLTGSEGLGENAGWFEKASAWASENLPLVSDLRTLAFELYKGATGCDSVSLLNVSFALIGLVTDIASFGTAGEAVRVTKASFGLAARNLLKRVARGVIHSAIMDEAIAGFMELATKEVARADGTKAREPADWVLASKAYLEALTKWLTQTVAPTIEAALRSVGDVFVWSQVYTQLGEPDTLRIMNEIETVGLEVEGAHP